MTERIYWLAKRPETKLFNVINHCDIFSRGEWQPVGTGEKHKRAFPEKMIMYLLSCFPQAVIVLDPFMGSGTTAVACKRLNRKFIGIEVSQEYVGIANKRMQES